jgi:DNA-binding NtrC family response regulator
VQGHHRGHHIIAVSGTPIAHLGARARYPAAVIDRTTMLAAGIATVATRSRTAPRSWLARLGGGGQVALGARPVTLGAHASCDLVVDDPKVSRRHTELTAIAGGVRVKDLGSTNGTWWQGSRVTEVVVTSGASIEIGSAQIRIVAADAMVLPPSSRDRFGAMVGTSLAMRELFAVLELAAPSDATVLIEGESGTGKELAARALHDHSERARGPFVVVDCSAIAEHLIDSHLFGHVRGAFTGAERDRRGAFVEASGGTLFLDELGELPLAVQAKLLRVLEAQTVQPVGADRPVTVDTRVVAATHRDLARMVEAKEFRFDLFYRLAVVHIALPSLRERIDDLPGLVAAFFGSRGAVPGPVDGDNLDRLRNHAWPGNVRELRNVLERAWAMSGGLVPFRELRLRVETIAPAAAADAIDTSLPFKDAKERWNDLFERRYLAIVHGNAGGNITRAAEHAGINRRHFRELLYKHGLLERPTTSDDE